MLRLLERGLGGERLGGCELEGRDFADTEEGGKLCLEKHAWPRLHSWDFPSKIIS